MCLFDVLCVCLVAWVGRSKPPVCAIHSSIHPNQSHIQPTSTTHSADLTDAASLDAVIGAFRPTVLVHAAGGLGCGLCMYVCVYCLFVCDSKYSIIAVPSSKPIGSTYRQNPQTHIHHMYSSYTHIHTRIIFTPI